MTEKQLLSHFRSKDRHIASLIEHYGHLPTPKVQRPFEALTDAIVSQQLSSKAASTIFNRFKALLDHHIIPGSVAELTDEEFASVGISRQKRGYLRALAEHFKTVPEDRNWSKLSNEGILGELKQIKGIGVWTVQMFLMFQLLRSDVFPLDDLGIRQGMIRLYGVEGTPTEQRKRLVEIAEEWRPYRSIACRYIWRYYGDMT